LPHHSLPPFDQFRSAFRKRYGRDLGLEEARFFGLMEMILCEERGRRDPDETASYGATD